MVAQEQYEARSCGGEQGRQHPRQVGVAAESCRESTEHPEGRRKGDAKGATAPNGCHADECRYQRNDDEDRPDQHHLVACAEVADGEVLQCPRNVIDDPVADADDR